MKNIKKIAIYDPYLDTIGGGEKHFISIAQVFALCGYEVDIIWDNPSTVDELFTRFNLTIPNISVIPNFLKGSILSKLKKTSEYEYLFYITDGSYFFSLAKHNIVFAMVPLRPLYVPSLINRLKLINYQFVANSQFTKGFIENWGFKNVSVLYPYIDPLYFEERNKKKVKVILTVGRFFSQLHSKRHDIAITFFHELKKTNKEFAQYHLVLVGGLKKEDETYFNSLVKLADNDPFIHFKTNVTYEELTHLYKTSEFYLHTAGFEIDEQKYPHLVEHLGIAPLEAMASGCITFCVNAGGAKEFIVNGENGYLYNNIDEFMNQISLIHESGITESNKISVNAQKRVSHMFSFETFKTNVMKLFALS